MHTERAHQRIVVIGQGHVGLPLAMAAVAAGFDVVGFDLDVDRTKNLADGTAELDIDIWAAIEADIVTVSCPGDSVVMLDDQTAHGALQCTVSRGDTRDLLEWTAATDVSWERRNTCP